MDFSQEQLESRARTLHSRLATLDPASGKPLGFDEARCRDLAPLLLEIDALKRERNAIILAHSYLTPEIQYGAADLTGDSYKLSVAAKQADAQMIVFAAVDFMAQTAKILNPHKLVVAPNKEGGCTLADSITGEQVRALRRQHPEHTFICYINTTADVKAACDVVVTSSNVYGIVEVLENDKIFFLPDKLMAKNIVDHLASRGIQKQVLFSEGTCYVHEEYAGEAIPCVRAQFPEVVVLAHPECKPAVTSQADYVGSTGGILDFVDKSSAREFLVLTECGLIDKLKVDHPQKAFVGSCQLCKYMKGNSLEDIRDTLRDPQTRAIEVAEDVRMDAVKSLEAMFALTEKARAAGLL
jgi:quinolinate synthase